MSWPWLYTGRNQIQETATSAQFLPGVWFLGFDFAVYAASAAASLDHARLHASDPT